MVVTLVIGIVLMVIAFILGIAGTIRLDFGWFIGYLAAFLFGIAYLLISSGDVMEENGKLIGHDEGQIDALKGIQTHQIHYVYPEGDTIPSDTLYLKIEE